MQVKRPTLVLKHRNMSQEIQNRKIISHKRAPRKKLPIKRLFVPFVSTYFNGPRNTVFLHVNSSPHHNTELKKDKLYYYLTLLTRERDTFVFLLDNYLIFP